jgi:alkylation response protein AidB-like acyl-CoA dehydrogenase
MLFALDLAGLGEIERLPGFEDAGFEIAEAVLGEAATFAGEVLDPLNAFGDKTPPRWEDGAVHMPPGFKEAYRRFAQAGWIGLPMPAEYGGQGLPQVLSAAVLEMWNAASMSFALGPLLNQGAIEALLLCGTPEQKRLFIPNLVSGKWMGTMVLTESQAGSDLAQVRTKAVPEGDHYRISGQKIFITYGEHDIAENIVHLILARTPTAPAGVKGISLFIVPKFLVNPDGTLGARNDVSCASIEHKLGIHASPTCVLNYGEKTGAIGYLIGEENTGLASMFIMMNLARFSVGIQGLAISDRAYQHALAYARERVQSAPLGSKRDAAPVTIIHHPDVRRMLMSMKARLEAMRALGLSVAAAMDHAHAEADETVRANAEAYVELMTPIVKGWFTEESIDITSTALQVHGGMGFIEETGAAQYYRDCRITPIYEGTTAIQANDLIGRKLLRDMGKAVAATIARMKTVVAELEASEHADLRVIQANLTPAIAALGDTSIWIGTTAVADLPTAFACSVPYLKLWGIVAGGWQMARAALLAERHLAESDAEAAFYHAKIATARFYAEHFLPQAGGIAASIVKGSHSVLALTDEQFALDRERFIPV